MKFLADLHVHSKFSRATSPSLDLENLYIAAQLKGITVVATGDFTHPGWFSELNAKLIPAEDGLFRLKKSIESACEQHVPPACRAPVRFLLGVEISNIYKKGEKTRKNHNLVYVPAFEEAQKLNAALDRIGNIRSDGRPILGLDARDLFEAVLDISPANYLVPAHIWTPWFSLLGSKSGFDRVEACFEDLTPYIFAVETGLSSDPPMNWRVSGLDGMTLVSNSDAHSPSKLGREANLFDAELSYDGIRQALRSGDCRRFLGTFEFYPQEGKYHMDGHRKCKVCCRPEETMDLKGICPVCGRPMTLGVLHRVEMLADRRAGDRPSRTHPFYSVVPMSHILSEIFSVGPDTQKVCKAQSRMAAELGSELAVLREIPLEQIDRLGIPLLSEAIRRVRQKEISVDPGFDGEFGKIRIFTPDERRSLQGQQSIFAVSEKILKSAPASAPPMEKKPRLFEPPAAAPAQAPPVLNSDQQQAVQSTSRRLIVSAGPGTGKTRTLIYRIAHLIRTGQALPRHILALTFTQKAAHEMKQRLAAMVGTAASEVTAATFHAFCLQLLQQWLPEKKWRVIDDVERRRLTMDALQLLRLKGVPAGSDPQRYIAYVHHAKQQGRSAVLKNDTETGPENAHGVLALYQELLDFQDCLDFDDVIDRTLLLWEHETDFQKRFGTLYRFILVDEFQDLDDRQHCLVQRLAPPGAEDKQLFVIGDPDQCIYGFRGSKADAFERFVRHYPNAVQVRLNRNYRSAQTILEASGQMLRGGRDGEDRRLYSGIGGLDAIEVFSAPSEKAEAVKIGRTIESLVGGMGFTSMDFDKVDRGREVDAPAFAFSDIAVLYRTRDQAHVLARAFDKAGIPYQNASRGQALDSSYARVLAAWMRIIASQGLYEDLQRTLPPAGGVGVKTFEKFKWWAYTRCLTLESAMRQAQRYPVPGISRKAQMKLTEHIKFVDQVKTRACQWPLDQRLAFIRKTVAQPPEGLAQGVFERIGAAAEQHGPQGSGTCLNLLALQSDTDMYREKAQRVVLMTMHASKGLEFPVVFIAGCEDGLVPLDRPDVDPIEEKRLFYVAMTRARSRLFLTYAHKRLRCGQRLQGRMSPFISQIEAKLRVHAQPFSPRRKTAGPRQLALFD